MIDEKTGEEIILAKDAKEGKQYLVADDYYTITIVSKNYIDAEVCSSVTVQSEIETGEVRISGDTQLIQFNKQYHRKRSPMAKQKKSSKPKIEKTSKEKAGQKPAATKKERKPKGEGISMSSIITPMLLSGEYTAEQVADAVIKQFPEKASEKAKLVMQIRYPRMNNLKKIQEGKGLPVPKLIETK